MLSTIDPDKLQAEQDGRFGPYFRYMFKESASLPAHEKLGSVSYSACMTTFCIARTFLKKTGNMVNRSMTRTYELTRLVFHAFYYPVSSGIHLSFKPTYNKEHYRF